MSNINIEVPDEIHAKAKIAATINGKTLKQFIIEKLAERLQNERAGSKNEDCGRGLNG